MQVALGNKSPINYWMIKKEYWKVFKYIDLDFFLFLPLLFLLNNPCVFFFAKEIEEFGCESVISPENIEKRSEIIIKGIFQFKLFEQSRSLNNIDFLFGIGTIRFREGFIGFFVYLKTFSLFNHTYSLKVLH